MEQAVAARLQTSIRGLSPQAGGFRRRPNRPSSVGRGSRRSLTHRPLGRLPCVTASVYQAPAVPYHTPIRGSLSTPNIAALSSGEQYNTKQTPLATIIFEFLFCASAQGEDSKEKKGCGGKEEWKENPFVNFGTKAPQALRHGSADCPWSIRCRGYGFLRGRPGFLFGRASRAAFFGSTAGLKSGYFAM